MIICYFRFAALIQKAVSEDEKEATEVFGFVGMFVTIIDGLMIIFINLIFSYLGKHISLDEGWMESALVCRERAI